MTLLDANVLLYAYNSDAPQQKQAARWLTGLLESGAPIGIPWITIWAFIRVSTNSRIWPNPQPAQKAFAIIAEWLRQPGVILVNPGPRHIEILEQLMHDHAVTGALVTDAVLAALALEYGASLASTDQDFRRFSDLQWINPTSE